MVKKSEGNVMKQLEMGELAINEVWVSGNNRIESGKYCLDY